MLYKSICLFKSSFIHETHLYLKFILLTNAITEIYGAKAGDRKNHEQNGNTSDRKMRRQQKSLMKSMRETQ